MPREGSDFESCICTLRGITLKLRTRVVLAGDGDAKGAGRKERKEKQLVK